MYRWPYTEEFKLFMVWGGPFISPFCWVAELIPYVLPLIGPRPSSLAHRRGEEDVGGRKSKEERKQEGECMEIRTEARKENKD